MTARRAERRKIRHEAVVPDPTPVQRLPVSIAGLVAAGLLAFICLYPLVVWEGNPYPASIRRYWIIGAPIAAAIAALVGFAPGGAFRALASGARAMVDRPSPRAMALIVAGIATGLSVMFAVVMFRLAPTTSDEVAQLWHARILLQGRFFLPPDPNPEFFAIENVIDVGRWYSQFPIGGPLVLSLGALVRMPWLVNPLLCGAAAAALLHFGRKAFGETQGRAVAILFSLTPMVLFLAGTWMNHVSVLALAMAALAALVEWEQAATARRRLVFAGAIGLCLGLMATIRPVDALVVSVCIGVFQLWVVIRDPRRFSELLVQGVAGAIGVAPLLYANAVTTGHPLRFGYDVMWGAGHQIGFHVDPYGDMHTPARAFAYAVRYVGQLNISLEAWPVPALALAIAALATLPRVSRWDVLVLALFVAQVAVYASYSLVGQFLGPRFLYTALPTIVILIARLPFLVGARFGGRWGRATAALTVACIVIAWSAPVPSWLNVVGLVKSTRSVRRDMRIDVATAVRDADAHQALVFVREPFSARLLRRMWGAGVPRADAARLLRSRDACSLLSAVRAAEADKGAPRSESAAAIAQRSAAFVPSAAQVRLEDRDALISSPASVTPECAKELDDDKRLPTLLFGPALPLEPIDAEGRINGDVIYVADLGERNELLRTRFGDRTWYRVASREESPGSYRAELIPY